MATGFIDSSQLLVKPGQASSLTLSLASSLQASFPLISLIAHSVHYRGVALISCRFIVGAAISMTYTTGQPIVFVGTGQRYTDIRSFEPPALCSSNLMRDVWS